MGALSCRAARRRRSRSSSTHVRSAGAAAGRVAFSRPAATGIGTVRLIFLVYVPRSGSTLLSRLLSEALGDCVVIPELRIPRELFRAERSRGGPLPADELRRIVDSDHQAPSLGLDEAAWSRCIDAGAGRGAECFLKEIARAVAADREIEGAIFKCGSLRHFWTDVERSCPDAEAIHIYRDPRGVVSSTIRAERPYHQGRRMGRGNPRFIARKWADCMEWAARIGSRNPRFHEVSFEDLCHREQETMAELTSSLQLRLDRAGPTLRVDPRESTIHRKVHQNPDDARTDAWIEELRPSTGRIVEWIAGGALEARGYRPRFTVGVGAFQRSIETMWAWSVGAVRTLEHHLWVRVRRPKRASTGE